MWSDSADVAFMAWLTLLFNALVMLLFVWIYKKTNLATERIEEIYSYLFELDKERETER